jgi:hypothetical protein
MRPNFDHLIASGNAAELAEAVRQMIGVEVPAKPFLKACRTARKRCNPPLGLCGGTESWSDGTWRCWLTYRILETTPPVLGCPVDPPFTNGLLHVAFVGVEETPDHIANLTRTPEEIVASFVARSKIGSTNQIIRPIDVTADRVVPKKD